MYLLRCGLYVIVKFDANGGIIRPEDGYPLEGDTGFAEDGSYWYKEYYIGDKSIGRNHNIAVMQREGWTWTGEWMDAQGNVYNGDTIADNPIMEDITVYAQWECTHSLNTNTTISCKGTYCTECESYYGDETDPNTHRYEAGICVCGAENIAPTGTITMKENLWDKFFNTITFGLFFKEYVDVTITADGTGSDVRLVEYLFSETELNETELDSVAWELVTESNGEYKFRIEPQNKGAVYVRITDDYGNATVINSDGIVV